MKHSLSLACLMLFSLSMTACKMNKDVGAQNDVQQEGMGAITAGRTRAYTASELTIARRICSNLKNKREFFETLSNGAEQFRFRAELRNCDNNIYNKDLFTVSIVNANGTDSEYSSNRENYFKDVVTDQSGILKTTCDSVIQTDNVNNVVYNGNFKYTVNFLIADGYDRYEITKSQKNSDGSYTSISSEAASIIGKKTPSTPVKFFGVEMDRVRYTRCESSSNRFSTTRQTWGEALTKF